MKNILIAVFAALAVSGNAYSQETAGRVLLSAGSVQLVRGGATSTPAVGTTVQAGDTFKLGDNSHLQIRMTDQSLVSLQPNTTFAISEYAFTGKEPGSQKTVLNLLEGAMRTVTGLIGRTQQEDYKVTTPTSTIGIRGTHYQVAHLGQPRGNLAAGTYGAVTDGRISVATKGGQGTFGADQHFHVARADAAAVGRAGPPPKLSQMQAPARPQAQQQEQQQAKGETTTTVASTGDARVSNASSGSVVSAAARQDSATASSVSTGGSTTTSSGGGESAPVLAQPAAQISVSGPATLIGGLPIVKPTLTGTVFYRLAGPFNIPFSSCTGTGTCPNIANGNFTLGVNLTQQLVGITVNGFLVDGGIFNISTPSQSGGIPATISNGVVTFNQTFKLSDFPQNTGSFRCNDCSATNGPGFAQTITFSGTIKGSQATLNIGFSDSNGSGSATAVLNQASPPNNFVAAATVPNQVSGNSTLTGAFWAVNVDSSGRLVELSSGATTGVAGTNPAAPGPRVFVNTASNTIKGSDPTAGGLVWGVYGNGASVTDTSYNTFNPSAANTPVHWITGTATNTLPSIGAFTYNPVGSFINNGAGTLNSATLKADFVARSIALNMTASQNANAAFTMAGTTSFSSISGRFGAGFTSVSCAGSSCPTQASGGSFGGFFAGANAEGAGVSFTAGVAGVAGVTGVVGLKR